MTYTEVQAIFDGDSKLIQKYSEVYEMLCLANKLKNKILCEETTKKIFD